MKWNGTKDIRPLEENDEDAVDFLVGWLWFNNNNRTIEVFYLNSDWFQ